MTSPSIVWFRDDLRLADNPALRAAIDRGEPVIALYVFDEESPGIRAIGGAAAGGCTIRWRLSTSVSATVVVPSCCVTALQSASSAKR